MREVSKIILHCSASDVKGQNAAMINEWHLARGFKKIGYHYFIGQTGLVEKGRDHEEIGAHCEGENAHSLGICLAGLSTFSASQFSALRQLLAKLKPIYPKATVHGHREFPSAIAQGKTCPVYDITSHKAFYEYEPPKEIKWTLTMFLSLLLKIFQKFSKRP